MSATGRGVPRPPPEEGRPSSGAAQRSGRRRVVAVAFSGGRDSTALLHATLQSAAALGLRVAALHVHHGVMPQADAWLLDAQRRCERWAKGGLPVEFHVQRLTGRPRGGESVEAWARRERYIALGAMAREAGASLVLLAHHRRDQAETFLLQALRGGGAQGLSAMPYTVTRAGLTWARPWLEMPRSAIETYVKQHRLRFVDDASNEDPRFARSRLRHEVWPSLSAAFADAEAVLASAARRAQQEAECLHEIAARDIEEVSDGPALSIERWNRLSMGRRANVLRAWLRACAGRGVGDSLVSRLLDELGARSGPARWPCDGFDLRRYRGRLTCEATLRPASATSEALTIRRPGVYPLPAWGGALHVEQVDEGGIAWERLEHAQARARAGGEQIQRTPRGVARSLKKQYQAAGMAEWQRGGPLLYCGDQLVFVPGLGLDARAIAPAGVPQATLRWEASI
jgi:tRNA(Ile)-lysidine synthase